MLERFCEIDKEYNGSSWNLLQILANINILIGEEPCKDSISRSQALSDYADWYGYGYRDNTFYKILKDMPPVQPKTGHWMKSNIGGAKVCSVCNAHMGLTSFKFCPNCGAKMMESQERSDKE